MCNASRLNSMYNEDTELLFPLRVIPSLKGLRGKEWDQLISEVLTTNDLAKQTAFVLLMVRHGGCLTCNADSYRAMRGCTQCARRTVKRIRDADALLIEQFQSNYEEVEEYIYDRDNSH